MASNLEVSAFVTFLGGHKLLRTTNCQGSVIERRLHGKSRCVDWGVVLFESGICAVGIVALTNTVIKSDIISRLINVYLMSRWGQNSLLNLFDPFFDGEVTS